MVCRRKKDRARNRGTCPTKQNLTSNPNHVKVKGILGHISWENSWCLVAFKRLLALILSHHFRHTHTEVPQMQGPRVVVQLPSLIQLIATPWTAAHQASLSITNSQSLLKFLSIELVMSSNSLSHLLSSPPPPPFNLSQHQGLFQWVSSSQQVAKILELQLQHQSFQWIFRTDFL